MCESFAHLVLTAILVNDAPDDALPEENIFFYRELYILPRAVSVKEKESCCAFTSPKVISFCWDLTFFRLGLSARMLFASSASVFASFPSPFFRAGHKELHIRIVSFCVDRLRLTVAEIDLPAIGDQLKRRCNRDGLAATVNAVLPEGKLIVDAVSAACGQHGEHQKAQRQRPFFCQ